MANEMFNGELLDGNSVIQANKDNNKKFLTGLTGKKKEDEEHLKESGNNGEGKLEYFTE